MQLNNNNKRTPLNVCLFSCFLALPTKSTAMVMAGLSVHLTTLFSWASFIKQLASTSCKYFCLELTTIPLEWFSRREDYDPWKSFHNQSPRKYGTGSWPLATPGSAVRFASVARHVTDCAMQPDKHHWMERKSEIKSSYVLRLYVPVSNFSVMSRHFPVFLRGVSCFSASSETQTRQPFDPKSNTQPLCSSSSYKEKKLPIQYLAKLGLT